MESCERAVAHSDVGPRIMNLSMRASGRRNMCMHNIFIHAPAKSMCSTSVRELDTSSTGEVDFWDVCVIKNDGNWYRSA